MKFLIFTTDVIPLPGAPTSGTALRTFGLGRGLESLGHQVVFSVPKTALAKLKTSGKSKELAVRIEKLQKLSFGPDNQNQLISEVDPDVVICGHWPAVQLRTKASQILIIDLAGPHMLERHYQGSPNQKDAVLAKCSSIASADGLIFSGKKQRTYFESYLERAGRSDLIEKNAIITMPLNPDLPAPAEKDPELYPEFIFAGVFLPWQDPSWALENLTQFISAKDQGRLTLVGGKHPHYNVKVGLYEKLFQSLETYEFVDLKPMLPFEEFVGVMKKANVALDLMAWNLERELAVTIRTTTYLWTGVPIIYNDFADLSELISEYDAGWLIGKNDKPALDATFSEIYENPQIVKTKSTNARKLASEVFAWDKAVVPLLELLKTNLEREAIDTAILMADSAEKGVSSTLPFKQSFICRQAPLKKVALRLTSKGQSLKSPASISLRKGEELICSKELEPGSVVDDKWYSLDIPSSNTSSPGESYEISLESQAEKPEIYPWLMHAVPYPMGKLYQGKEVIDHATLCIKTIFDLQY